MLTQTADAIEVRLQQAAAIDWQAVVVGAGPAGAIAARQLALAGRRVLLLDRARFPRFKVCGCCLNGAALQTLRACGLETLPVFREAAPLSAFRGLMPGAAIDLPLPAGLALSRSVMDPALIAAAEEAGATFLPETNATLDPEHDGSRRHLRARHGPLRVKLSARVVIAADGLSGRLLSETPEFTLHERRAPRVGGALIINTIRDSGTADAPGGRGTSPSACGEAYQPGVIYMASVADGYAGLVRLEDGQLNIATAVAAGRLRTCGGLGPFVQRLLRDTGLPPIPELEGARWHGAGTMTRSRTPLAGLRVFVIGDAAGYVEPFTGEGMGIALASGLAVVPLATAAIDGWRPDLPDAWRTRYRRLFAGRRRLCRLLTLGLRSTALTRLGFGLLRRFPGLAAPYVRYINQVPVRN